MPVRGGNIEPGRQRPRSDNPRAPARRSAPAAACRGCTAHSKATPERSHSRLKMARSNPTACPITTIGADEFPEFRPNLREIGSVLHARCVNAVNFCGRFRDRIARPDQRTECRALIDPPGDQSDRTDFQKSRVGRIESGGFGIDHHRIERHQRGGMACRHRRPFGPGLQLARTSRSLTIAAAFIRFSSSV